MLVSQSNSSASSQGIEFEYTQKKEHESDNAESTERECSRWQQLQRLCLSESLQSWWDNEVWPRATDLQFCLFHRAANTTWQLTAFISLHLGYAACQHPSSLPSHSASFSATIPSCLLAQTIIIGPLAWPCVMGLPVFVSPVSPLPSSCSSVGDVTESKCYHDTGKWANCC